MLTYEEARQGPRLRGSPLAGSSGSWNRTKERRESESRWDTNIPTRKT